MCAYRVQFIEKELSSLSSIPTVPLTAMVHMQKEGFFIAAVRLYPCSTPY